MHQHPLFTLEEIFDRPFRRYELFFSVLDLTSIDKDPSVGRKPISRSAILRALIFKNLKTIASLSDLSAELFERPALASILGFELKYKPIPVERFSSFLKSSDNKLLQEVRVSLVKREILSNLVDEKPHILRYFITQPPPQPAHHQQISCSPEHGQ